MVLTKNFSLDELTRSDTAIRLGIDQTPPPVVLKNLQSTAENMEIVRALLGHPVRVSSGFRSLALNRALKSEDTSEHIVGMAVDFTCPGFGTPKEVAEFLAKQPTLKFNQLIYEGTWIHISFSPTFKREVLTIRWIDGKLRKLKGIQ